MKNLTVSLFAAVFSLFVVFSQAQAEPELTLKQNMKEIGRTFKAISTSAADATMNETNAAAAGKLVLLFSAVLKQIPDAVTHLPSEEQAVAMVEYQRLITNERNLAGDLKTYFILNDNEMAVATVKEMAAIKKDGHDMFGDN